MRQRALRKASGVKIGGGKAGGRASLDRMRRSETLVPLPSGHLVPFRCTLAYRQGIRAVRRRKA